MLPSPTANFPSKAQDSISHQIDWDTAKTEATQLLSQYIQFDTTNPPGNELAAIEFLADTLRQNDIEPRILKSARDRANLVCRINGQSDTKAPACLLYAHADVVPADAADWSVPPFHGQIQDGYVWGRGALDNKGLGIIFLQVLSLLKGYALPLNRDIILLIAADEEVGGRHGAAWLLDHHPDLIKAEFVWDEGGVGLRRSLKSKHHLYQIAVAEKGSLTVKLVAHGSPGHASIPHPDNAQDRLIRALVRVKQWQQPLHLTKPAIEMLQALAASQPFPRSYLFANAGKQLIWPLLRNSLERDPLFAPLIRNTLSLTVLRGGQSTNVIPTQTEAILDMRLLPGVDPARVLDDLRAVINDPKISVIAEEMPIPHDPTPSDTSFFRALTQTLHEVGPPGLVTPYLTPGTTDSRYFRRAGMKAYGFLPMLLDRHELSRIHGIDERVSSANLRWGMQLVFETLRKF